jgi:hypothetical protein
VGDHRGEVVLEASELGEPAVLLPGRGVERLALPLDPAAVGDVADEGEDVAVRRPRGRDRREAELDGDLLARLAQGRHLDRRVRVDERPPAARGVARQAGPVGRAQRLRDQQLDRPADDLLRGVAEQSLGRRVPEGDQPAVGLADHDGVADRLEQQAQPHVPWTERRLGRDNVPTSVGHGGTSAGRDSPRSWPGTVTVPPSLRPVARLRRTG